MSPKHTSSVHASGLLLACLLTLASLISAGCTGQEDSRPSDIATGEPDQRNELNRSLLDVDDNFGSGMGQPVHHADW